VTDLPELAETADFGGSSGESAYADLPGFWSSAGRVMMVSSPWVASGATLRLSRGPGVKVRLLGAKF
jgi:hypothetical protein